MSANHPPILEVCTLLAKNKQHGVQQNGGHLHCCKKQNNRLFITHCFQIDGGHLHCPCETNGGCLHCLAKHIL